MKPDRHYYHQAGVTDLRKIEEEAAFYARKGSSSVVHYHPYAPGVKCGCVATLSKEDS